MKHHAFGRMPFTVTNVGFGAWQIGGSWGDISEADGRAALNAALDAGMTFIDTADVYGDGRSEKIIADVLKTRGGERPMVATKAGRRLNPHVAEGYSKANLEGFIDRSLKNLAVDSLDLVQLHCPPREVFYQPEVFDGLDALQRAGKIKGYGVSVEKVEDGLKAIEYPGVVSIQIIYNIFRQRPDHLFFAEARRRNVAIIARVPLASGLLSGKITRETHFASDDHRNFNRHGEAFDVGETFAGVPFEVGLQAVEEVRKLVPRRRDDGRLCAALDPDERRRHRRHPRRPQWRTGQGQCRGRRSRAAFGRCHGGDARDLRAADRAACASALVGLERRSL